MQGGRLFSRLFLHHWGRRKDQKLPKEIQVCSVFLCTHWHILSLFSAVFSSFGNGLSQSQDFLTLAHLKLPILLEGLGLAVIDFQGAGGFAEMLLRPGRKRVRAITETHVISWCLRRQKLLHLEAAPVILGERMGLPVWEGDWSLGYDCNAQGCFSSRFQSIHFCPTCTWPLSCMLAQLLTWASSCQVPRSLHGRPGLIGFFSPDHRNGGLVLLAFRFCYKSFTWLELAAMLFPETVNSPA